VKPANPNHLRQVLDAEDGRLVASVTHGDGPRLWLRSQPSPA
jgi:hypothetical protein